MCKHVQSVCKSCFYATSGISDRSFSFNLWCLYIAVANVLVSSHLVYCGSIFKKYNVSITVQLELYQTHVDIHQGPKSLTQIKLIEKSAQDQIRIRKNGLADFWLQSVFTKD